MVDFLLSCTTLASFPYTSINNGKQHAKTIMLQETDLPSSLPSESLLWD